MTSDLRQLPLEATLILGQKPPGFIERFGHVEYSRVLQSSKTAWRRAYLRGVVCEMDGCNATESYGSTLVFDHCHRHRWVRGVLCNSCNVIIGRVESLLGVDGIIIDFGNSAYGRHLALCPDCPADAPDPSKWLPAQAPFGRMPLPPKTKLRRTPCNPDRPIARPGSEVRHLAADNRVTVCGRVTDAFVSALAVPSAWRDCAHCFRKIGDG